MSSLRFKIKDEFISTTTELVSNSITVYYKEVIDSQAGTTFNNMGDGYEWADGSATYYEYGVNNYETTVPVIIFACEEDYADAYRDKFYYIGTDSIDGITYDKWQKIEIPNEMSGSSNQSWTSREKQFIYTNIIVEEVSAKLNNFGLAELTLKTANKWCTADIDVKIDSAEIENIKPEYLRSDVEVFGISGSYGEAVDTVTIPAGIYELIFNPGSDYYAKGIFNFYYCGSLYTGFYVPPGNVMTFYRADGGSSSRLFLIGSSASNPGGMDESTTWLEYLVYVPEDMTVSKEDAEGWYSQMHPYVSSAALNTHTFKLPNKLPCSDIGEAGAYIRDLFEILGEAEPDNAGYSIDMLVDRCVVPFQAYANDDTVFEVQRVDLKENPNSEELRLSIAGDRESNNSFGEGTLLYSGGTGGSAYYDGQFSMGFGEAKDYQYWHFKNNYSEINPTVLAFLIAIGAEADPTFECERCGETCYVSDCEVLWRCDDCKDKICNHTTGAGSSLVTTYKRLSATNHLETTRCKYCTYTVESTQAHTMSYMDASASTAGYYYCYKCNMPADTANCSEWHDTESGQPCSTCGLNYSTCSNCGTQWFYDGYCSHCGYSGSSGEACPHNNVGDNGYCFDCGQYINNGGDENYYYWYCGDDHGIGCKYSWSGPAGEQPDSCPYCSGNMYCDE